jgi:three-Cys-motif partner protein
MSKGADYVGFDWEKWETGEYPPLEYHSEKKLDLLHDYLVLYLEIVLKNTLGKEIQEITIIDGFAGGGIYQDGKVGSPLTILKAIEAAEELINNGRDKRTKIVPTCYFIEQDACAFACLEATLKSHGYGDRLDKTIHLRKKPFEKCVPEIVHAINQRHKGGGNRTIFFLDQCGYVKIPASLIKEIDIGLHQRAEFIVNFSITWLSEFISDKMVSNISASLKTLGLEGQVDLPALLKQRVELGGSWKHAVESHIGQAFHRATGIKFFSPFYIEPLNNHRGYWLLHLAQSSRARAAMTQIHWSKHNRSRHYGPKGYGILSYKPEINPEDYITGMAFNDTSRQDCSKILLEDYARLVTDEHKDGIAYEGLADLTANNTIADTKMLNDVVWELYETGQFDVRSPAGLKKRSRSLRPGDILVPNRQFIMPGIGAVTAPSNKKSKPAPLPS